MSVEEISPFSVREYSAAAGIIGKYPRGAGFSPGPVIRPAVGEWGIVKGINGNRENRTGPVQWPFSRIDATARISPEKSLWLPGIG
ncbi:MAG: hypothetical protein C6W56_12895 [Caldibacillus debilis]|nr:MAG: hypothetical protein C6W56_12895 [Caldibacillus debilis]